jgi:endonuclease-3
MSSLTVALLGAAVPARKRRVRGAALLAEVADRFVRVYGAPSLGNFADPVEELFYILLSARTAEVKYLRSHRALRTRYPTLEDLAKAPVKGIQACIADAGLSRKRARQVKEIAGRLLRHPGPDASDLLRKMSAEEVFAFLTGLPGVAAKSALCVMMYSLGWDVFPVDVNARRVATRLGLLRPGLEHRAAQASLPAFVPEGRSKELHVGFVVHGRTVCPPRRPACERCPLNDLCPFGRRELRKRKDERNAKGKTRPKAPEGG